MLAGLANYFPVSSALGPPAAFTFLSDDFTFARETRWALTGKQTRLYLSNDYCEWKHSHSPFQSHGNENKERLTLWKKRKKKVFYRLYSEFSWCLCEPWRHLLAGALFFCCPKCNLELSQLTHMSTTSFSSTQTGQTWVWEPLGMRLSWMQCWPSYSPHFSRRQWQGPTPSGWSGKETTPLFFLCSVPMSTLGDSSCSYPVGKYANEQAQTSPSLLMWESCMAAWDHRGRRWASLVIRARLCHGFRHGFSSSASNYPRQDKEPVTGN